MSQERAFIEAIIARPDDDLPRLIYADWLEENAATATCPHLPHRLTCERCQIEGNVSNGYAERAEFIRVQCELALWGNEQARPRAYGNWYVDCRHRKDAPGSEASCRAPSMPFSEECQYHALRRRERELIDHNPEWLFVLPPGMRPILPDAAYNSFRRGFVESVTCTAADWLRHGDNIVARTPIAEVTLTTWPHGMTGEIPQGIRNDVLYLLKSRWPRVKTWNLPQTTMTFGQPMTINEARRHGTGRRPSVNPGVFDF